jgi:hypothetical protein
MSKLILLLVGLILLGNTSVPNWPNPYRQKFGPLDRSVNAESVIAGCPGYIGQYADYVLDWQGYQRQGVRALQFSFLSQTDTALFIQAPDGSYSCVWDAFATQDPAVTFTSPQEGVYRVWIASSEPVTDLVGTLFVIQFVSQG